MAPSGFGASDACGAFSVSVTEAQRSGRDCRARGERGDVPRGVRPSILLGGRPCEDSPGRLKCVVQVRVGPWGSYIEKPNCAVVMGTQLEWIAQFFFCLSS